MTHPMRATALLVLFCFMLPAGAQERPTTPVTDAMLQDPDPADWLMWRRTLDHWGHSPLDQVNADNVDDLELVWSRPLHSGVQEGTPLVYDGVMFFPNPSDVIQAMDAATGEVLWEADLGSQVTGYPVTYAVDDKQYVAVSTGGSLTLMGLNRLVSEELQAGTDTNLFVFALPD